MGFKIGIWFLRYDILTILPKQSPLPVKQNRWPRLSSWRVFMERKKKVTKLLELAPKAQVYNQVSTFLPLPMVCPCSSSSMTSVLTHSTFQHQLCHYIVGLPCGECVHICLLVSALGYIHAGRE